MDSHVRRRGQYFKYLKDPNELLPASTSYNRAKIQEHNLDDFIDDNEADVDGGDECALRREIQNFDEFPMEVDQVVQDNVTDDDDVLNDAFPEQFYHDIVDDHQNNINEDENDILRDITEVHEEGGGNQHIHLDDATKDRVPMYQGAPLTVEESNHLIMSFAIRHQLTDVDLENVLQLIDCHLPTSVMDSKHKFLKNFPALTSVRSFYYCPTCFEEYVSKTNNMLHVRLAKLFHF